MLALVSGLHLNANVRQLQLLILRSSGQDSPSDRRLDDDQGGADPPANFDESLLGPPPPGLTSPPDGSATSSPALHGASPSMSMQLTSATASFASGALLAGSFPANSPMSPIYANDPPFQLSSNPPEPPASPPASKLPPQVSSPQLRRSPRRLNPGLIGDDPPSPNVTYTRGSRRRQSTKGRGAPSPLGAQRPDPSAAVPSASPPVSAAGPGSRAGHDITAAVPALSTLLEESEGDLMSRSRSSAARSSSRDRTVSSMPTAAAAAADPTDVSMDITLGQTAAAGSAPLQGPHVHSSPAQSRIDYTQQTDVAMDLTLGVVSSPDAEQRPMDTVVSQMQAIQGQHVHDFATPTAGGDMSMDLTFGAPAAWKGQVQQSGPDLQAGDFAVGSPQSAAAWRGSHDTDRYQNRQHDVIRDMSMELMTASAASSPAARDATLGQGLLTLGFTGEMSVRYLIPLVRLAWLVCACIQTFNCTHEGQPCKKIFWWVLPAMACLSHSVWSLNKGCDHDSTDTTIDRDATS